MIDNPDIPDPEDPRDDLLRWGLLGAATALTFGGLAMIPPWPEDVPPEPVEVHETFDRRPLTAHERAVYRALIELHAPRPVDRSPVLEDAPEPPLVPMAEVVTEDGDPAIPSAVDARSRPLEAAGGDSSPSVEKDSEDARRGHTGHPGASDAKGGNNQ